jgi:transposase
MHLEHKAGDKMFVDFTGKKFYLTDKETGKLKAVETFVAILPCSQYTYVCATETQKTPDWIKGSQLAFRFFGGTTTAITPDCFKSAVTKHNRYDPDINPEYSRFAEHYDTGHSAGQTAAPQRQGVGRELSQDCLFQNLRKSSKPDILHTFGIEPCDQ